MMRSPTLLVMIKRIIDIDSYFQLNKPRIVERPSIASSDLILLCVSSMTVRVAIRPSADSLMKVMEVY